MSAFGREVARLRAAAGLSKQGLANRSGLDRSHVSRLEAGLRHPERATVARLVAALAPGDDGCRLYLAAGYVPPGYTVTALARGHEEAASA